MSLIFYTNTYVYDITYTYVYNITYTFVYNPQKMSKS